MNKCPSCAAELPTDASLCSRCGSNLAPAAPPGLPIQPQNSGKAIASLVLGLLFPFPPTAILAIIFGHLAYAEIRRSAGRLKGKGMAIAGLVLGYSSLAVVTLVIVLSMVTSLIPWTGAGRKPPEGKVLASIGRQTITTDDLDQTIRDRFKSASLEFNRSMVPMVAPAVLDHMVIEQILIQQAGEMGLEVSDQEVQKSLQAIPTFCPEGSYVGDERAAAIVTQSTGKTFAQFKSLLRDGLLVDKIRHQMTDGVQVTPAEVQAVFLLRNTKARIDYVLLDPARFIDDVKVTPEALEAFFQKDPAHYQLPEQRQVRYVVIDPGRVHAKMQVSEGDLRQYYAQHLADYRLPDRIKVAHILFRTTGKSSAEAATLERTAAKVLNQIHAGASFGDLARKYSEDATAPLGGELGWVARGQTVASFEAAAFALNPGEVSALVRTEYGIHIIKVEDKQAAHSQPIDKVRSSILPEVEKQQAAGLMDRLTRDLETKLKANPQQFEDLARQAGLEFRQSPLFKPHQAVPGLGRADAFVNLAFQLQLNEVGAPVPIPEGQAIIQLIQIVPTHVPALAEVRSSVEEDYRRDQSARLAQDKAQKLADLARTRDFDQAAKSLGLNPRESTDFSANEKVDGVGSGSPLAEAFTLNPGQVSSVISVGPYQVLFKLVARTSPNAAELAAQSDRIRGELREQKRDQQFESYGRNQKTQFIQSGKLKINDAGMKQYLASYQAPS